jgi:hypothetical protein
MSAMPAYTDALTFLPFNDVPANRIDAAGDFVTRHTWILKPGQQSVLNQDVAVANAARLHFHAHLTGAWLRDIAFYQFPISTGLTDLCRLHFHIHK